MLQMILSSQPVRELAMETATRLCSCLMTDGLPVVVGAIQRYFKSLESDGDPTEDKQGRQEYGGEHRERWHDAEEGSTARRRSDTRGQQDAYCQVGQHSRYTGDRTEDSRGRQAYRGTHHGRRRQDTPEGSVASQRLDTRDQQNEYCQSVRQPPSNYTGAGGMENLVIKQHPEESWLEAVTPVILDQLKKAGDKGSFLVSQDTVLSIKRQAQESGRKVEIRLRRHNEDFELQIFGHKVGTVESLSNGNNRRYSSSASSKTYSTRDVQKSPFIFLDTTAPSRHNSVAYVYAHPRKSSVSLG